MKHFKRTLPAVLALALLLSGCGFVREKLGLSTAPTTEATEAPTEQTRETAAETVPETVPQVTEPEDTGAVKWNLQDTVFPDKDAATGTLFLYVNGTPIYAGGKVSDLIDAGMHTYDDMDALVAPHEMSELIRVRVDIPNEDNEDNEPLLFFVAMNPGEQEAPIRDCLFYSLTVNLEKGVKFGSGKESQPFLTEITTRQELETVYGAPTEVNSQSQKYAQTVYYQPFNCAYFTFKNDVVRQVFTYYSANVFGDLTEQAPEEIMDDYFGGDCFIAMSQYMDVTDYLPGHKLAVEAGEDDDLHAQRDPEKNFPKAGETGVLKSLPTEITVNGEKIKFGIRCSQLPETWWKNFEGLMMPIERNYYYRVGRNAMEEFYLINDKGQKDSGYKPDELGVKGMVVRNSHYTNWGKDYSGYYDFNYDGLTQDSTIEDVLEKYGQPSGLFCSSNARMFFAWMNYDDEDGTCLRIKVDPLTDQLMELQVTKYFPNEMRS